MLATSRTPCLHHDRLDLPSAVAYRTTAPHNTMEAIPPPKLEQHELFSLFQEHPKTLAIAKREVA